MLAAVDKLFFDQWKVKKISVFWGSFLLTALTLIAELTYLLVVLEFIVLPNPLASENMRLISTFSIYLLASGISYYASHALIHFVIGRSLGIKFHQYFIFRASFRRMYLFKKIPPFSWFAKIPMWLGIKYDLGSFLKAAKWKRTLMFISAPILSSFWFILNYSLLIMLNETWKATTTNLKFFVFLLNLMFYVGSLTLSYFRFGDLWKARQDY